MLGMLLWGIGASMALAEENEKAKTKSKEEELKQAKKLLEKWLFFCGHSEEYKSPLQEETEKFLGKTISQIETPEGVEEIRWQRKNLKRS